MKELSPLSCLNLLGNTASSHTSQDCVVIIYCSTKVQHWIHWQYWECGRRASKALLTLRHTIKVRLNHTHTHTAIDLQIAADSQSAGNAALWLAFSECRLIYSWISLSLWPPSDTNTHTLFPLHVYVCGEKAKKAETQGKKTERERICERGKQNRRM